MGLYIACGGGVQNAQHVVLAHDDVLAAIERNLTAGIFAKPSALMRTFPVVLD
jgi:hypothetical protein